MKRFSNKRTSLLHRLTHEEKGSVMALTGLAMLMLVGVTGMAVDMGRAQLVQAKLSSSLDAAGLAAGSTLNTTNLRSETQKYVNTNFHGFLGSTVTSLNVSANTDNTIITLDATATMPTRFMPVLGIDSLTVRADSEITRASSGLELVMVLDNTGSMAGSKLTNLKSAATEMMDILYGSRETVEDLWVGLVPFSQAVNIGSSRTSWLDSAYLAGLNWGPTSWGGCVDARNNSRDTTDDPPSVQRFLAYYWPDDSNNDWRRDDGRYRTITATLGPNKNCPQAVTPMTAHKSTIVSSINAMTAVGNTHIGLGAVWGWRMLSPRWRTLWGGEMNTNSLPLDYNTPKMNKAAIIMTDGDNTMDNSNHTAYWYLRDNKLGTTNQTTAETRLDSRLSSVCTSMKNNNIIIYTISFGTVSSASQTMLRNCATQADFYFPSPSNSDLQNAFRAIGDSLANLRVSR